jgi:hypothetical protein
MYDIYLYTYYKHRVELFHSLKTIGKYVNYDNLYVVYDDIFYEEADASYVGPIKWELYEDQLGDNINIINQSSLYNWEHQDVMQGWYRQQYCKMLIPTYSKKRYNIICDGGHTFFIKPYTVFENNIPILYHDTDWRLSDEYFPYIEKYTDRKVTLSQGTYVGSCSLWDNTIVQNILDTIENLNGKDFIQCCREHIDNSSGVRELCFSEFETYGTFAEKQHIVKPYNFQYVTDKNFRPKIKDTTELLIFSNGFAHCLEEFLSVYGE